MRSRIGGRAGIGALVVFAVALALTFAAHDAAWAEKGGGGKPGGEAAGNNLSFPVLWSDGTTKALRECLDPNDCPYLAGAVYYWWGADADGNPESCLADLDNTDYCDDGADGTFGVAPCEGWYEDENSNILGPVDPECTLVYPQQVSNNIWQAESADWSASRVDVHWIDWGDNLESVDWYTRSQVRTEVVLTQDLVAPMLQYDMKHLSGWGIDELWGLHMDTWDLDGAPAAVVLEGSQATVYSHCARLTIQRLLVERDDPALDSLVWMPLEGWVGEGLINAPIFNKPVWEGGDGPGYYSAEINVKGKIIYGYTWNVRKLNEGAGDYRITFSFDGSADPATCPVTLNTFFTDGVTQIVPVSEEEEFTAEADDGGETGGAVGVLDFLNNLTYMDVRILERSGGKPTKVK